MTSLPRSVPLLVLMFAAAANADVPIAERNQWSGTVDFHVTGAPLAVDGADLDTTQVDTLLSNASVAVTSGDVPAGATLVQAFVYWTGSITNDNCVGANVDRTVNFTPPGGSATAVTAATCACSDAAATSYDVQSCRADVTSLITSLVGTYTVGGFSARASNSATDNASFALVLVYADAAVDRRKLALYDGLLTMENNSTVLTLGNVKVGTPAQGKLAWYVAEGDVGGGGTEQVTARSAPNGTAQVLTDAVNPAINPMNHTINTVTPARTDTLGVDLDVFDITASLVSNDTAVEMTYTAGADKHWLVFNLVGIDVFEAKLAATSAKTVALRTDADSNGVPSAGDTLRYTIRLDNSGNAPAVVDVTDPIPSQAASWILVNAAGGTNASTGTTLVVNDVPVAAGANASIIFDVTLAAVPDQTPITNVASFDAAPVGDTGSLTSPTLSIRRDRDGDTVFDNSDNCPDDPNTSQTNSDGDARGDVCDACPLDATNDPDGDGVCQTVDNCGGISNADQLNSDGDALGDACDACPFDAANDPDADGVCQNVDNCGGVANGSQANADGDALGDACDACPLDATNDPDADGVCQNVDNCGGVANGSQVNADGDALGDACDSCPLDEANDPDGDGVCQNVDNCRDIANSAQTNTDGDAAGDVCDICPLDAVGDTDGDGICLGVDNCPQVANTDQADADGDGNGDACDICANDATDDADGDGVCQDVDNCGAVANPHQLNTDGDARGDACDVCVNDALDDEDADGLCGEVDNCPQVANDDQVDVDENGVGDACEERIATLKPTCGCGSGGDPGVVALMAFALFGAWRLRRRT